MAALMGKKKRNWWLGYRVITVMIIPERTRNVHRLAIPFFMIKLGIVLVSLVTLVGVLLAVDYVHILGRMAENKRLKGENFKLRQDLQLVRNKVETMEGTIERVRNYAKKLQLLTEQVVTTNAASPMGKSAVPEKPPGRTPAGSGKKSQKRSQLFQPMENESLDADLTAPTDSDGDVASDASEWKLERRLLNLQTSSALAELSLSRLQTVVIAQSALMAATPSLIPIAGSLSSQFGYRRHPLLGRYRLHAGCDIAADPGTPVRAPADGTVIFSGLKDGYGKVVVIDHGYGIRTLFAHSSRLFVTSGLRVKRGEKIAEVGATGKATGPHLHYEIRKNGVPVNPVSFFNQARF